MARFIQSDGTSTEVHPADGQEFTYQELRSYVGGDLEFLSLLPLSINGGLGMFINEDGIALGLPINEAATAVLYEYHPAHQQAGTKILGNVLIATAHETGDD